MTFLEGRTFAEHGFSLAKVRDGWMDVFFVSFFSFYGVYKEMYVGCGKKNVFFVIFYVY